MIAPTPGSGPGAWVPTPPGFLQPTTGFLGRVTPFTMDSLTPPPSGAYWSSVGWGDCDNDGDLDILLTGTIGRREAGPEGRLSSCRRRLSPALGLGVEITPGL